MALKKKIDFQTNFPNKFFKQILQTNFPNEFSKQIFSFKFPIEFSIEFLVKFSYFFDIYIYIFFNHDYRQY